MISESWITKPERLRICAGSLYTRIRQSRCWWKKNVDRSEVSDPPHGNSA